MVILSLARASVHGSAFVRFVGLGHAAGFALEVPIAEDEVLGRPERVEFVLSTGRLSVHGAFSEDGSGEVREDG